MERTLVLLKPDAVERNLIGRIITRFEEKGLKIVGLKLRRFELDTIREHYAVHRERPFYEDLVSYMTSGPVAAIAIEGKNAIEVVRGLMGTTNAAQAPPGTIRGDFGMSFSHNLVHGSDGPESAEKELGLFFGGAGELVEWAPVLEPIVYNAAEEL